MPKSIRSDNNIPHAKRLDVSRGTIDDQQARQGGQGCPRPPCHPVARPLVQQVHQGGILHIVLSGRLRQLLRERCSRQPDRLGCRCLGRGVG